LISFLPRYAPHGGSDQEDGDLPVWDRSGLHLRKTESADEEKVRQSPPKRRKTFDPEAALADVPSQYELGPARSPPETTIYDTVPLLVIFKPLMTLVSLVTTGHSSAANKNRTLTGKRRKPAHVDSNVPLELTLFLNSYLAFLLKASLLAPAAATAFNNGLVALQDSVANLDRVRNTPLPFAYQGALRSSYSVLQST
jgi:putative membrane protein